MKKLAVKRSVILLLCLGLLCSLLAGCQSREAASAQKQIAALAASAPAGEAVEAAREAYEALSEEDRQTLENYDLLVEAETQYHADVVDALIDALGGITLESGPAIESAREAYDALETAAKDRVDKLSALTAAETEFHRLTVEAAAADIDAVIDAIGKVTLESGPAIQAAREALESADEEVLALVSSPELVEVAEDTLHRLQVRQAAGEFDAAVEALGEITEESRGAVEAARAAYEKLDAEVRAQIGSLSVLEEAEQTLVFLDNKAKAEALDADIAGLGDVTLDKENDVAALRKRYDALPSDVQSLMTGGDKLKKAERSIQGLKDKAAAAEVKRLSDDKQYDEAIAYAEKYIHGRDFSDIQGDVVKNCLNAYVAKANALMKESEYLAAWDLLQGVKEDYKGADLGAVNKAVTALNKATAEPVNGKIYSSTAKGGNNKLTIKIGDKPMYVKFVDTKNPKSTLTVYIRANKSVTVYIKNGEYTVKYATGDKWFGTKDLFGSETRCGICDDPISFNTPSGWRWTGTLTLKAVANGNLTTSSIPPSTFNEDEEG